MRSCPVLFGTGSLRRRSLYHTHSKNLRHIFKTVHIKSHPVFLRFYSTQHHRIRKFIQIIPKFSQKLRRLIDMDNRLCVNVRKLRHHLMAYPVTAVGKILVRDITTVRLPPALQKLLNLTSAALQQRPDVTFPVRSSPQRLHSAESIKSAPPNHLQQNSFRIILHMMCKCNPAFRHVCSISCKDTVTQNPCRLLQSHMVLGRIGRHIHYFYMAQYPQSCTQSLYKLLILPTVLSANSMLHMNHFQRKIHFFG